MALVQTDLTAKDIMTPDPVCVAPSTRLRELARVFEEHEISGAPVVDQEGRVVGVVSKTDLIRRCTQGTDELPPAYLFEILSEQGDEEDSSEVMPEPLICVEDLMTEDPLMVGPGVAVATIARLMHERGVHRVIVTDTDRFPLGVVTSMDVLGVLGKRG